MKKIRTTVFVGFCLLWCFTQTSAEDTIKIAGIWAKTGVAGKGNLSSFQGTRFAVQQINRTGGLLGKKVELLEFDNHSTPIGSAIAAEQAIERGVVAILGASWSSHSLAIAEVAQAQGVPMISNFSTNPKVTQTGNYIFRICFIDPFQGKVMAQFATQELQAKTAIILIDLRSDYSIGLSETFQTHFEKMGGTVLTKLNYKQKQEDYRLLLQQVKQAAPQVLFIGGHGHEAGLIVKQAQDLGIQSIPLGGDGWNGNDFFTSGGHALKLGYLTDHWTKEVGNQASQKFLAAFPQNDELNSGSTLAYDATMVLAQAIRHAGSTNRQKIREALAQTKDFQGITGMITFNQTGDPIKSAVIMQIKNGAKQYYKTVHPH